VRGFLLLGLLFQLGCARAQGPVTPPELPRDRYAKCSLTPSQTRPLVVEWTSADRARLESLSRRGLVVVRYSGCEMELLSNCRVPREYKYTPVTLQTEHVSIRNVDELYAKVPIGAARLEGELADKGELAVDMTVVGTWDVSDRVARSELVGDCSSATHVLASLTSGAFTFRSGASRSAGGGASVAGFSGGGETRAERNLLSRSGDPERCAGASSSDAAPPEGCGAVLRVEAVPVAEAPAKAVAAGESSIAAEPSPEPAPSAPSPPPAPEPDRPATEPPASTELRVEPGFLVGLRGPFAVEFGPLEGGVSLHRTAPVAGGVIAEVGYRFANEWALALTGTLFSGTSAGSSAECPSGVKCKALVTGAGTDVIWTPNGPDSFWAALGGEWGYLVVTREGDYQDAGTSHMLATRRSYHAFGPRLTIGRDFSDSYVPQILYGFCLGYSLRQVVSASGKNELDGQPVPLDGDGGLSHTILLIGRIHGDFGIVRR